MLVVVQPLSGTMELDHLPTVDCECNGIGKHYKIITV